MIGFELEATGSNGFRHSSSAWSEGSLIALKVVLSLPKANPSGMGGARRGMLDSIESSFSSIAKSMMDKICADGVNFTLFVKGDMNFKYYFDYSKSSDEIKTEFLRHLGKAEGGVGDQVLIHFCRTINDFFTANFSSNGPLILNIDIDL